MSRWRFVKLVRDGVGKYLPPEGEGAVLYRPVHSSDLAFDALVQKLLEEAVEFAAKPSIEELADVYEVVRALADRAVEFVSMDAVIAEANAKRAERGGFDGLTGMYVITTGEEGVELP